LNAVIGCNNFASSKNQSFIRYLLFLFHTLLGLHVKRVEPTAQPVVYAHI